MIKLLIKILLFNQYLSMLLLVLHYVLNCYLILALFINEINYLNLPFLLIVIIYFLPFTIFIEIAKILGYEININTMNKPEVYKEARFGFVFFVPFIGQGITIWRTNTLLSKIRKKIINNEIDEKTLK